MCGPGISDREKYPGDFDEKERWRKIR